MNKTLFKPGAAAASLQKLFVIFLLFTFILAIGSFLLKYSITQKLDKLSQQLKSPSQEPEISSILLELNSAENDFQQAGLQGYTDKLAGYKEKLQDVFNRMQVVFQKYHIDSTHYFAGSRQHIAGAFQQKLLLSANVLELKKHFDSLLNATTVASINGIKPGHHQMQPKADTVVTLVTPEPKNKPGFLKRLKNAISNKNQGETKVLTIHEKNAALSDQQKRRIESLLYQLKKQNSNVQQSNQKLIAANFSLLAQFHEILQQLKDIGQAVREKSRNEVLNQYEATTANMNTFIGVAISLVLVFIVLLIFYIGKATSAEQNYLAENERAVALARQKTEILAIMSHEIRNPLTAITGTIYMLSKTPLTPEQEKKLSSIKLSSSTLIETVNNILDLGKLEHEQAGLLAQKKFSTFQILTDAMESMRFMAEKKGVALITEFSGDTESEVTGDAFRLKQVMLNLLSNSIKYTDEGSVTIIALIEPGVDKIAMLRVRIKDTGIGIPKEKQAKLFTRYYQAHEANVKPGTGLGLYLCQQLVQLQGGSIGVESEVNKGCTFYFNIPYHKA